MTRFLALCSILALSACDSPTGSGAQIVPLLRGSWEYAATQDAPQLRMSGTLAITEQLGDSISGSLEYVEVDAGGTGRPRLHLFTGRVRGGEVTINAYVGNRLRIHIGTLVGDSLSGGFEQTINETQSFTGSFLAVRE